MAALNGAAVGGWGVFGGVWGVVGGGAGLVCPLLWVIKGATHLLVCNCECDCRELKLPDVAS